MLKPLILAGGADIATHLVERLEDPLADSLATALLFNFVENGLMRACQSLIASSVDQPLWKIGLLEQHLRSKRTVALE